MLFGKKHNTLLDESTRKESHKGPANNNPRDKLSTVINISKKSLSAEEMSLLNKGLNYAMPPRKLPMIDIATALEDASNVINQEDREMFRAQCRKALEKSKLPQSNITRSEAQALKQLKKDDSIKILPADKGNATVVMDSSEYDQKISDLINTDQYVKIKSDRTACVERNIKKELNKIKKDIPEELFNRLNPNNSVPPHIYGLPKIHKQGNPLRPIVSCIDSPCHKLAKYLTEVLNPLVGNTSSFVKDSKHLVDILQEADTDANDIMASYDVESLFTNVPTEETLEILKEKLDNDDNLSSRTPIPKDSVLALTRLCITTTYFQYKDDFYQQKSGMAMGSPLSPLMANMFMEWFEQRAIDTAPKKPKMWLRYVDDVYCQWQHGKESLQGLLDHLNGIHPNIRFTMEVEQDGKLPFLDVNIERVGNKVETGVYYKKTHTGRYLDFNSNHPRKTKAGIVKCLANRARNICNEARLKQEFEHLKSTFHKNGYPKQFTEKAMQNNNKPQRGDKPKPKKTVTLPYIPGISEKLGRICGTYNIRTVYSSKETLGKSLRKVKPTRPKETTKNVVYQIPCKGCDGSYIGESCRCLSKRLDEHKKAVKAYDQSNGVARHAWEHSHHPNWEEVRILDRESHWHKRKIKEALHMKLNRNAFSEPSTNTSNTWLPLLRSHHKN